MSKIDAGYVEKKKHFKPQKIKAYQCKHTKV